MGRRAPGGPTYLLGVPALAALVATVALAGPVTGPAAAAGRPSASVTSPVDLATPVDLGDGTARAGAVVRVGGARIEVLSPSLLRLEYSPTGHFEDLPTVNAVDRRRAVPPYRWSVSGGWLTVRTSEVVLRYRVGSGPFTMQNTSVRFSVAGRAATVHPTWEWECTFGQVCQAGAASLAGGATISQTTPGYQGTAGYVGNLDKAGAAATWQVLGAQAGPARLVVRYSSYSLLVPVTHDFDVVVNGRRVTTLTAPPPNGIASPWQTLTTSVPLRSGTNTLTVRCDAGEGCEDNIDTVSVAAPGSATPAMPQTGPLGGWIRGFDTATYTTAPICTPGETAATCQAGLETLHTDGLLDTAGWRLLDDTHTAVWTRRGWVQPRPAGGDLEDGYLFVYGHDYAGALHTLAQLTGPAPLLPAASSACGTRTTRRTPALPSSSRSTRPSWPTPCR